MEERVTNNRMEEKKAPKAGEWVSECESQRLAERVIKVTVFRPRSLGK